jgi:hypothetical protein
LGTTLTKHVLRGILVQWTAGFVGLVLLPKIAKAATATLVVLASSKLDHAMRGDGNLVVIRVGGRVRGLWDSRLQVTGVHILVLGVRDSKPGNLHVWRRWYKAMVCNSLWASTKDLSKVLSANRGRRRRGRS